jgi:hypothetical protein
MATDKSKRRESLLKVAVLAIQLLQKTIDVCSSKNNFPIRKKWAIPSDLYLEAREYCVCVNLANDVRVTDRETALLRLGYDEKADQHLNRYMILNNIAILAYPMGESTINSWVSLLNESYEMFQKWYKADKERYKELLK